MSPFQIIFNPTSAAELARLPKELQLYVLGEFRGLPHEVMSTDLEQFGRLERAGKILHRLRLGDYRVYFERHDLGVVVHRILEPEYAEGFSVPFQPSDGRRRRPAERPEVLGIDRRRAVRKC